MDIPWYHCGSFLMKKGMPSWRSGWGKAKRTTTNVRRSSSGIPRRRSNVISTGTKHFIQYVRFTRIHPMRTLFHIALFVAAPTLMRAQTVSGSWYGRADVDLTGMYNNYLTELVIKQKGNRVDGIFGYYFRNKYESYLIHGTYNPKTREIIIRNLPVIYYGSN